MSAYSDWKCGAISDDEYRMYCTKEARRDEYLTQLQERDCINCIHYVEEDGIAGCELWECENCTGF